MRTESSIIELADKILVKTSRNNSRIGLFDGKSGISFYYYLLNSQAKNFSLAEILIDDVVNRLKIGSTATSFATGISSGDGEEGGEFSETKASVGYFNILEIIIYN